jgi:hypothetical protein
MVQMKQQISGYELELQMEPTQSLSAKEQQIVAKNRAAIEEIRQQLSSLSESKLAVRV